MKQIWKLILIAAFLLVLLTACLAEPQESAIQLPDELVMLIGILVMTSVTALFKWLSAKLGGVDLSGDAMKVAAALASVIVVAINYGLKLIPVAYDSWLGALFAFLIVLFGGAGFYSLFLRRKKGEPAAKTKVKK